MTKINLLPPEKIKKKGAVPTGRLVWVAIILPIALIAIAGIWWFSLGSKVNEKEEAIKVAQSDLKDWKQKNQALEQYQVRLEEIKQKELVVVSAISGRIYWARILDHIARACPSDIWLTSVTCTGSQTEGTVEFQGYTKQCRNRWAKYIKDTIGYQILLPYIFPGYPFEITPPVRPDIAEDEGYLFRGDGTMGDTEGNYVYFPDYRPIARWIEKMEEIPEFARVWLATAAPEWHSYGTAGVFTFEEIDGVPGYSPTDVIEWNAEQGDYLMSFSSRANLDMNNAQIGPPISAASAAPSPQPQTQESTEEGGEEAAE